MQWRTVAIGPSELFPAALTQIGATSDTTDQLVPQAQFRPRAFENTALRQLNLKAYA